MKALVFIISFIISSNIFSQDISKIYDKFENKFYLSLKDDINIPLPEAKPQVSHTYDFQINVLKIYNSKDTIYYLRTEINYEYDIICSTIDTRCIVLYDENKSIVLKPSYSDVRKGRKGYKYYFDFPVSKNELLTLQTTKQIGIKIYCEEKDDEMEGKFDEDDLMDIQTFITNYVK